MAKRQAKKKPQPATDEPQVDEKNVDEAPADEQNVEPLTGRARIESLYPESIDLSQGLPDGDSFECVLVPDSSYKKAIRGFLIHGLDRSKFVGLTPARYSRKEIEAIIKTVEKEGHEFGLDDLAVHPVS